MSQTRITQFGTVGDKPLHLVQSQTQVTGNLSANHSGDGRDTSTDGRALSDGLSKTRGKKKSLKKNKNKQRKVKRKPTEPPRSNTDASITEILGPSLNELLAPSTPMPNGRSGSAPSDSSMTSPQATSSPTLTAGRSNSSPKHRGRGYSKQPANRQGTRITAVKEQLEQQVDENLRLTYTIKLLEKEIDKKNKELNTKHKADMAQKLEIKKLSQSNDELRRELSQFKGMGKYVSRSLSTSDGCSNTDT